MNTQIRLITRRGFGYHSPWAVIALAMSPSAGSAHACQASDTTQGCRRFHF